MEVKLYEQACSKGILNKLLCLVENLEENQNPNIDLFIQNNAELIVAVLVEEIHYLNPLSKTLLKILSYLRSNKVFQAALAKIASEEERNRIASFYVKNLDQSSALANEVSQILSVLLNKPVIDTRHGLAGLLTFSCSVKVIYPAKKTAL